MTDRTEAVTKIVVCEGDAASRGLICEHLAADGFEVLPAAGAGDALCLCRHENPDLLLLDLALPDAAGLGVLRGIREADGTDARLDPRLAIIALTGDGVVVDRTHGLDLGADDSLQKRFLP